MQYFVSASSALRAPNLPPLLSVVVEMLCEFQWKLFEIEADRGIESIGSVCLELMTVAAACQENEIAKDFFTAVFQSDMCREYLRNNNIARAKRILQEYCADWTEEQFIQAEILVMGIQYSTITINDSVLPLKTRISGALNQILSIYNVSEEEKNHEIQKVLEMDCRKIGKKVLKEFIDYVNIHNEQTLEEILQNYRHK